MGYSEFLTRTLALFLPRSCRRPEKYFNRLTLELYETGTGMTGTRRQACGNFVVRVHPGSLQLGADDRRIERMPIWCGCQRLAISRTVATASHVAPRLAAVGENRFVH